MCEPRARARVAARGAGRARRGRGERGADSAGRSVLRVRETLSASFDCQLGWKGERLTILRQWHERAERSAEEQRGPDGQRNAKLSVVDLADAALSAAGKEER